MCIKNFEPSFVPGAFLMLGDVLLQRLTEQVPFCALFRATAENLLAAPLVEALLERTAHGQGTKELT